MNAVPQPDPASTAELVATTAASLGRVAKSLGETATAVQADPLVRRVGAEIAACLRASSPEALAAHKPFMDAVETVLGVLTRKRFQATAVTLSDRLLALGFTEPMIVAVAAHGLCDLGEGQGAPLAAIALVERFLSPAASPSLGQVAALGALGRANKDMFAIAMALEDTPAARTYGHASLTYYQRALDTCPHVHIPLAHRWAWRAPMVNMLTVGAALLREALAGDEPNLARRLDGLADTLAERLAPAALAKGREAWDEAALAELAMYRGDTAAAAASLGDYVAALANDPEMPFKAIGTLRQWSLLIPKPPDAVAIQLNALRGLLLGSSYPATLVVRDVKETRAPLPAGVELHSVLPGSQFFEMALVRDMGETARGVGAVLYKPGNYLRIASGFAVKLGELYPGCPAEEKEAPVFLTNAHVSCWTKPFETEDGSSAEPKDLAIRFDFDEAQIFDVAPYWPDDHDVPLAIAWLDLAVLKIVGTPTALKTINTIPIATDDDVGAVGSPAYVVGYPKDRPIGVFLGGENIIPSPDGGAEQHVYYAAGTERGQSGAPVLVRSHGVLKAAGIHVGANFLANNGRGANFGIRFRPILDFVTSRPRFYGAPAGPGGPAPVQPLPAAGPVRRERRPRKARAKRKG